MQLRPLRGGVPYALPGAGGPDRGSADELETAFFAEEAGYGFRLRPLFHETPFNQVGGAYAFSMAPRHAQMVEQGLQIFAERCAQAQTVLAETGQHIARRQPLPLRAWAHLARLRTVGDPGASPVARVGAPGR